MIGRAHFTDLRAMVELDRLCFPAPTSFGRTTLLYYLYLGNTLSFVDRDEESGEVRGFVIASWDEVSSARAGDFLEGHIITLDIHPAHRRRGIALNLMDRTIGHLRNRGTACISLEVAVSNRAAIDLYSRLGFRSIAVLCNYYLYGDRYEDAYRMQFLMG